MTTPTPTEPHQDVRDILDRLASNAPSTYAGIRHTIAGELRALAAAPSETEEGRA